MTSLTLYGTNTLSTTLSSTGTTCVTALGGVLTSNTTKIGTSTGYGELWAIGNTGNWPASGSLGTPSGRGFLWDVTTLEGQGFTGGNWTPTISLKTSTTTATADIIFRAYKRSSGGTYTSIGSITLTAQSLTTTQTAYSLSATALTDTSFATGDKLYVDVWLNITASGTGSTKTVSLYISNSTTAGIANAMQVVTPGYTASGAALTATLAGVGTLTSTLTESTSLTSTLAGTGTLSGTLSETTVLTSTISGIGLLSETFSLATALTSTLAGVGTLTPTLSATGGVSLSVTIAGQGTLTPTLSASLALPSTTIVGVGTLAFATYKQTVLSDSPIRYYRLDETSGTTAVDIGSQAQNGTLSGGVTLSQTRLVTDTGTSMLFDGSTGYISVPTTGLPTGAQPWSVDIWFQDIVSGVNFQGVFAMGTSTTSELALLGVHDDLKVYVDFYGASLNSAAGVAALNTTLYVAATYDGTTAKLYINGVFIDSTVITLNLIQSFAYLSRNDIGTSANFCIDEPGIYSTALTSAQVAAHYMAGLGVLTTNTALTCQLAGIGTFTVSAPTFKTALTVTIAGQGTLAPTLSANLALASVTLPGVGTLIAAFTKATVLSQTLIGTGTLIPTVNLATALSVTINGTGTLIPTLSSSTNVALAVTESGAGTLALSAWTLKTALTSTVSGIGILAPALTASFALPSTTLSGLGTFTPAAFTESTALTGTISASGTLSPTLSAALALPSTTISGVGTFIPSVPTYKTALTSTISGAGTLAPTLVANLTLPSAIMGGVGTFIPAAPTYTTALAATTSGSGSASLSSWTLKTAFSLSINGAGTLSGAMTAQTALSLVCAASGTLTATSSVSTAISVTLTGLSILTGTIIERSTKSAMGRAWIILQGQVQYYAKGRVTISAQSTYNARGRVSIAISQIGVVFVMANNTTAWDAADNTMTTEVGYNTSSFKI